MRRIHLIVLALFLAGCQAGQEPAASEDVLASFAPLPTVMASESNPMSPARVDLGRMLFYDARFSAAGDISCYVCHPLHDYGTSHRRTGVGHEALQGSRNDPTVYNAAGHVAQFWDGRSPDVEDQALGPVLNPVEMAMPDGEAVVAVLRSIPGYREAFAAAFPEAAEPVTFENFGRAIGAFERGLTTPSRWDAYLDGDAGALTSAEVHGLEVFMQKGCVACHSGAYVGGQSYYKVGLVHAWPDRSDAGRFEATGDPADSLVFKAPSLRNVAETWPYFHDGSVQRLPDAVALMAWHQSGIELAPDEVDAIVAWLKALTGVLDSEYIRKPDLPAGPESVLE